MTVHLQPGASSRRVISIVMSLSPLLLDVLLVVFRDLDVIDIICVGMVSPPLATLSFRPQASWQTCKHLYRATQDRHVWVDQLCKLHQAYPELRSAKPPLTFLSAQELKSFVVGWIKLRFRRDNGQSDLGFSAKGLVGIPRVYRVMLLPGGKSLLAIDNRGGLALRRIELEDGQVSLPVVANIKSEEWLDFEPGQNKLLITMSPYPILVRVQRNKWDIPLFFLHTPPL